MEPRRLDETGELSKIPAPRFPKGRDMDAPLDMRIIRNPAVYVMGRQTVNDAELERFLADHGVSWQTDTEIASELLCETAGRVCYMSFAKPRPGGNATYLGHIKEVGHGSVL